MKRRVGVAAAAAGCSGKFWDKTQLQQSVFLARVDKANAVSRSSFFPVFFFHVRLTFIFVLITLQRACLAPLQLTCFVLFFYTPSLLLF